MTKEELRGLLNRPYSRDNWKNVVSFVFPNVSLRQTPAEIPVKDRNKDLVESFKQLGDVRLNDGKVLALFELKLKRNVSILRNRVRLNEIVSETIDQETAHGVLSIFEQGTDDYRFTFSAKETAYSEAEADFVQKKTDAKRYTYLLGKNESCKTPADRFFDLGNNKNKSDINAIQEAFSVEKLSKQFFKEYKEHYQKFVSYLTDYDSYRKTVFKDDDKSIRDFVKLLLGRLVFIQFVQKKKWLGVPSDSDNWHAGDACFLYNSFKSFKNKDSFYSEFLEPLFYEALNKSGRSNDLFSVTGTKIPYLNGGLFDRGELDTRTIDFPADHFEGLLEFFDRYNFTIDENDPEEHEVGIDPEMLGSIFENLLEDNKDKGAFYTPKEIVHYMCQESLKEYLKTFLETNNSWPQDPLKAKEADEYLGNFVRNKVPDGVSQFDALLAKALRDVKICDPAIGSGAFPMGLLIEIYRCVYALYQVSPSQVGEIWGMQSWEPNTVKKNIIQKSIYGVDIEKGAVDIARLRFWLSLIIDETEPHALPNLDYKVVVGNSLVSKLNNDIIQINWSVEEGEGFQANIFGSGDSYTKIRNILQKISSEQKDFFTSDATKSELSADIRKLKIDLLVNQLELMVSTNGVEINFNDNQKINSAQKERYQKTLSWKESIVQLKKIKEDPNQLINFFDWKLDFPEVLNELINPQPGFDIIIANPPYVSTKGVNDDEKKDFSKIFGFADDLYYHFFIKGFELAKKGAVITMITPDTYFTTLTKKLLRNKLTQHKIKTIVHLGHDIFESAMVSTAICIVQNIDHVSDHCISVIDAKGAKELSKSKYYNVNQTIYKESINGSIFIPNEINIAIHDKLSKLHENLMSSYWERITTSRDIEKNKKFLEEYRDSLKAGDMTLVGLVTEGGQGLATANNGKYVGVKEGAKEAKRIRESRIKKLAEVNKKLNLNYQMPNSELEVWELFDRIKEVHGRDIFGQGYLFRIVPESLIAKVDNLSKEERENGIDNNIPNFVPYDKGDKDGNRWYLPTPYYIQWNKSNVEFFKTNSGKKGEGMPVVRNPKFYFREGFCYSDIKTFYLRCRLKGKSVYDVKSMSFFSVTEKLPEYYLTSLINSKTIATITANFIANTPSFQINDCRALPIIVPTVEQLKICKSLFDQAYDLQFKFFAAEINKIERDSALAKVQDQVDNFVRGLYGF